MYNSQSTQAMSHRRSVRDYGGPSARRRQQRISSQEKVRLLQLTICFVLFLVIFLWKGVFPQKLNRVREDLFTLITTDLDFRASLTELGEALSEGDSVLANLGTFCVEVFGAGEQVKPEAEPEPAAFTAPLLPADMLGEELYFLSRAADMTARTVHYADPTPFGLEVRTMEQEPVPEEAPPVEAADAGEPPAVPAAGTVVMYSDYSGDPLPGNYTMDQLSLGELETVTPVMGRLTSEYGYREHPILGKVLFHGGVDIGGQEGDPVAAFADGKVEYTGKDDSYGLYLQVDHGNGVKSFYAHCSKIVVTKGQAVARGEKLAEIGSTGISTGPHLHLELKYGKMHLNPAYYVEFSKL